MLIDYGLAVPYMTSESASFVDLMFHGTVFSSKEVKLAEAAPKFIRK